MDHLRQDVLYAVRRLIKAPGFTLVAVITLALGIGANSAIFSVVNGVLLKPLVFPEPDRVVQVWMAFPERAIDRASWSHANFWDARDMATTFDDMGAMEFGDTNLTGMGDPEKLDGARVNAGFFRVLGVAPVRDGFSAPERMLPGRTRTW